MAKVKEKKRQPAKMQAKPAKEAVAKKKFELDEEPEEESGCCE